jgi:hypothetical protein
LFRLGTGVLWVCCDPSRMAPAMQTACAIHMRQHALQRKALLPFFSPPSPTPQPLLSPPPPPHPPKTANVEEARVLYEMGWTYLDVRSEFELVGAPPLI